ncbi:MAG TPA: ABC transporter permease [Thermoanaerobaculia bacterium]
MLSLFGQEIRRSLRSLVRSPGFTGMAVVALALGIGANTALFTVIHAVLLRPYPYEEPDRILRLQAMNPEKNLFRLDLSLPDFADFRQQSRSLESLAAVTSGPLVLDGGGEPRVVQGARASASLFAVIGAKPALGRTFLPNEDEGEGKRVAVLSDGLWRSAFGADPAILGRTLQIEGEPYTVVGVLPPFAEYPDTAELWIPLGIDPGRESRQERSYTVLARLARGSGPQKAQAELNAIAERLAAAYPETNAGWRVQGISLAESRAGRYRSLLAILFGVAAFVLLLACANVANLLLQRAIVREREVSVRMALGAGRAAVVRLMVIESLVLALLGGALGLAVSRSLLALVERSIPFSLPAYVRFDLSPAILAFTLLTAVVAALLFGVLPALRWSGRQAGEVLASAGVRTTEPPRRQRLRRALVVSQVALALMLLVGAALMARSYQRLQDVDPGFDSGRALSLRVLLPSGKYAEDARRAALYRELLERLESLPGVRSAAADSHVPLNGAFLTPFTPEGETAPAGPARPVAGVHLTMGNYFPTLGLALQKGRTFSAADGAEAPRVAIVSARMARQVWPGQDPIGKRFQLDLTRDDTFWTVVGVAGDVRFGLDREPGQNVYVPYAQLPRGSLSLLLRTASDPLALAETVRREIRAVDPDLGVADVRTLGQVVETSIWYPRLSSRLLGVFALFALALAVVGIYSSTAYSVAQRTHEIGIRMALGAQTRDALRLVVGKEVVGASIGVAIGLAGAFALTRVLRSLLFEVSSTDPVVFVGAVVLLLLTAAGASYLPARRASRVDPVQALRTE